MHAFLATFIYGRAYHFFETMVDAHCVRDEGSFTVHWLVGCVSLGRVRVRAILGCKLFREYVNHVVEKAVRYALFIYVYYPLYLCIPANYM